MLPTARELTSKPNLQLIYAPLAFTQVLFGLGSVIASLGLPACNPFAFALYREVASGLILLLGAAVLTNANNLSTVWRPMQESWTQFVLCGLAIYGNQAGVITGIKLAGGLAASIWQPSQPIMTAAICMALKREPVNRWRVAGVMVAFCGCALMVLLTDRDSGEGGRDTISFIVGNFLFFVNCLSTALYVVFSKQVVKIYPPLLVTAWSYNVGAIFMALTTVLASLSPSTMNFLCSECDSIWGVPERAWFALAYFIVFNSVIAYAILTWSNQYATGTLVMGFAVLQPVSAALLSTLLLTTNFVANCQHNDSNRSCLDPIGWGATVGMMGVFGGLYLVTSTEPSPSKAEVPYEKVPPNEKGEEGR